MMVTTCGVVGQGGAHDGHHLPGWWGREGHMMVTICRGGVCKGRFLPAAS